MEKREVEIERRIFYEHPRGNSRNFWLSDSEDRSGFEQKNEGILGLQRVESCTRTR